MPKKNENDDKILERIRKRFRHCENWESYARPNYDIDTKFANADSINNYQWLDSVRMARLGDPDGARPCLTINKTKQHNNAIINDAKQNKAAIHVRPISDGASYEASQVYNDIIRHIEYRSNAQTVYDHAGTTQVEGGIGYWRILTDFESPMSFDQEISIVKIPDPRSVYLDPDIKETDGSDARFGFIFENIPKDLFDDQYPDEQDVGGPAILGQIDNDWFNKNHIRVAEYFEKSQVKDRLVSFIDPMSGQPVKAKYSDLSDEGKQLFKQVRDEPTTNVRDIITDNIKWYKIAGNKIIDERDWIGIYIPIVRVIGTEVVIDGRMDRFGNTRSLLDPQRMYNYNASNYVELVALQPRSPFVGSAQAIEGHEEKWYSANVRNHSVLTYNEFDEEGNKLSPPQRSAPPQMVPAYMQGMDISEKQMMMASGQYQAQMGENENAKSGVAINARQRQGDRATYHFIDNLAVAMRFTGKILIDLIPKIYDTPRVLRIMSLDGAVSDVQVDPEAPQAVQKAPDDGQMEDKGTKVASIIFNPNVGTYDVVSDVGPDYATKRQETLNALTQIASQNQKFMDIGGDILFKNMDFAGADTLAQRYARMIPPNISGDQPDPHTEQAMHMATDKIQQLQGQIAELSQKLKDKDRDVDIKAYDAESRRMNTEANQLKQIDNARTSLDGSQLEASLRKVLAEMLGKTPDASPDGDAGTMAAAEPNVGMGNMPEMPQAPTQ